PAGEGSIALESRHGTPAPPAPLVAEAGWIDQAYAADDVSAILERLDSSPYPGAATAATALRGNSPLSTQTALRAVRAARDEAHLPSALARELRVADYLMKHPDLPEGIRAQIIDKDRMPQWSPTDPAEVDQQEIAAAIAVD
ncbi:MAG: enoyl-CoA hydratase/isomerase family protein, partial [Micrococcaceae bacterium]|nr:enoyl-CoA hydratase/isomerase family protein [Micrococcaceae bacterium]